MTDYTINQLTEIRAVILKVIAAGCSCDADGKHLWTFDTPVEVNQPKRFCDAVQDLLTKPAPEQMFRIEKRSNEGNLTEYWRTDVGLRGISGWILKPEYATLYTEKERQAFLNREVQGEANDRFPAGGIWVRVEQERKATT